MWKELEIRLRFWPWKFQGKRKIYPWIPGKVAAIIGAEQTDSQSMSKSWQKTCFWKVSKWNFIDSWDTATCGGCTQCHQPLASTPVWGWSWLHPKFLGGLQGWFYQTVFLIYELNPATNPSKKLRFFDTPPGIPLPHRVVSWILGDGLSIPSPWPMVPVAVTFGRREPRVLFWLPWAKTAKDALSATVAENQATFQGQSGYHLVIQDSLMKNRPFIDVVLYLYIEIAIVRNYVRLPEGTCCTGWWFSTPTTSVKLDHHLKFVQTLGTWKVARFKTSCSLLSCSKSLVFGQSHFSKPAETFTSSSDCLEISWDTHYPQILFCPCFVNDCFWYFLIMIENSGTPHDFWIFPWVYKIDVAKPITSYIPKWVGHSDYVFRIQSWSLEKMKKQLWAMWLPDH